MPQHNGLFFAEEKHLYLTSVQYNEEKKEVLAEFSSAERKFSERFSFFPFAVLSSGIDPQKLSGILLDLGIRGFEVKSKEDKTVVLASSFNELKRISTALGLALEEKPLIIEPERQFLAEKKWSLFDSFVLSSKTRTVEHVNCEPAQKDLGFFLTKQIPFKQALELSEETALFLVERAAYSSLLNIPADKVPDNIQDRTELFLENLFFRNGAQISWGKGKEFFICQEYAPLGLFDSVSSIDFSFVWAQLFAHNFFNLGADTSNCNCCKPLTLSDKNLYPSSLIEVEFNEDNFYFESSSHSFALSFHKNSPFKDNRLSKRKEFFMKSFPVGPFFRGDKAKIPLIDAKKLLSEERATLGEKDAHALEWFCTKKEGFLSIELSSALNLASKLNKFINTFNSGLFEEKPFSYYFASALVRALNALISEIPFQLMNINSKFFSLPLAKNILAVQEATMYKFREFSEANGYRVLHADNRSAFVKGFSSIRLAKRFAKEASLPQPSIRAFSKQTKIVQMA